MRYTCSYVALPGDHDNTQEKPNWQKATVASNLR